VKRLEQTLAPKPPINIWVRWSFPVDRQKPHGRYCYQDANYMTREVKAVPEDEETWLMKQFYEEEVPEHACKAISFNTFRHWGATMTYHYTGGNLLLVQKILGHKRITSTMKYTQLVCLKEDEYDIGAATTIEEDQQLLKTGFEYVTERNGIKLYRRPKMFAKYMDKR
jgi:integrase